MGVEVRMFVTHMSDVKPIKTSLPLKSFMRKVEVEFKHQSHQRSPILYKFVSFCNVA